MSSATTATTTTTANKNIFPSAVSSFIPCRNYQPSSKRLPESVSIVGLGCSSFSTAFWTQEEFQAAAEQSPWSSWTPETINRSHPRVQEWIQTIHYAILEAGITLLDTAPWYGNGTSEIVIGWALEELLAAADNPLDRSLIQINTKLGRYEADPTKQFDFSREMTEESVHRSLERMKCDYIDVLQLHDPEFAPSLDQLFTETIPVLLKFRAAGLCRAIGLTGYPLSVQHLILQRSLEEYQENIWDQVLTYSHYTLHDTSLTTRPLNFLTPYTFFELVQEQPSPFHIPVLCAAPLSMGLLTEHGPPEWHPASPELKAACRQAVELCRGHDGVNISTLATVFALSNPKLACTILGMKNIQEVQRVQDVARRIGRAVETMEYATPTTTTTTPITQDDILQAVLTETEYDVLKQLLDLSQGPFAQVTKNGLYQWDGIEIAWKFWEGRHFEKWQL